MEEHVGKLRKLVITLVRLNKVGENENEIRALGETSIIKRIETILVHDEQV